MCKAVFISIGCFLRLKFFRAQIYGIQFIAKVYEKLLLHCFQKIPEKKTYLTGGCQPGFKKNLSTKTARL